MISYTIQKVGEDAITGQTSRIRIADANGRVDLLENYAPLVQWLENGTISIQNANGEDTAVAFETGFIRLGLNQCVVSLFT